MRKMHLPSRCSGKVSLMAAASLTIVMTMALTSAKSCGYATRTFVRNDLNMAYERAAWGPIAGRSQQQKPASQGRTMHFSRAAAAALVFASMATPLLATPVNTTAAAAVSYEVGQGWVSHYIDESTQNRWFKFTTVGGRGYCVEAAQGSDSPVALNPNVTVYTDVNGTTALGSNDNGSFDPPMTLGARYCFADSNTLDTRTVRTIRVNVPLTAGSGDNGYARLRVYESTIVGYFTWNGNAQDPNAYSGQIDVYNYGATPITVYYQTRGVCFNLSVNNYCGAVNPSGSVSIAPRSSATIQANSQNYTTGYAWLSLAFNGPLTNVQALATSGTAHTVNKSASQPPTSMNGSNRVAVPLN